MSSHFNANQYEAAFSPQRLQNYQVPATHKQHPSLRLGCTRNISNDRGHLKPNIPRSSASPWGNFIGTWQVTKKPIQLKTRTKLATHLSQIDQKGSGSNSKRSSRAASARMSCESQRGGSVTSPRPQSAQSCQQEDNQSTTDPAQPDSKPPTPTGTKSPTESGSKPLTPNTEAGSKPPTPNTEAGSKPPTPQTNIDAGSRATHSQNTSRVNSSHSSITSRSRVVSAASTRSNVTQTSLSSASSRAQSATILRTATPHQNPPPPSSAQSHISSIAVPYGKEEEGIKSPLSSTRVSTPSATAAAADTRVQTANSEHPSN